MPANSTQTFHEFIYAGRLGTGTLLAAGIVLTLVIVLLVWREARRVRWWLIPPLLLLRLVAVGVVLWMLAEPTMQTTVRHTRQKAIGMFVDASASMDVADGTEDDIIDADVIRWAMVRSSLAQPALLAQMDGIAAALAAADQTLARLSQSPQSQGNSEENDGVWQQVGHLVQTATDRLDRLLSEHSDAEGLAGQGLATIRSTLTPVISGELSALRDELQGRRPDTDQERADQLRDVHEKVTDLASQTHGLADELARWYCDHAPPAMLDRVRAHARSSRREKVAALLESGRRSWLAEIQEQARLLRYRFDRQVLPVSTANWRAALDRDTSAAGLATDLSGAIQQAARDAAGQRLEAVVMVTDGAHNTETDPLQAAAAMSGPPVYVVPIGNTRPLRDVILHHAQAPRTVFKDDLIVFEAMIDAYGCAGEQLTIDLTKDDQILESREIEVPSSAYTGRLTFAHKAVQMGIQKFELQAHPLPEERIRDNNRAELSVQVAEDKIRALLAENLPHWEFRYLRNLFKRDEHLEYESLLFSQADGGHRQRQQRPRFPQDLESWSRFRVVILRDVGPRDLNADQQELLDQYVKSRGGTLILIAGDEAMPAAFAGQTLERMLPVELSDAPPPGREGFALFVTAEGRTVPFTRLAEDTPTNERLWREQITLHKLSAFSRPKPTSHVLISCVSRIGDAQLSGNAPAFLCWHYYGRGRVVYLSAPATYRLRYRYGDRYHHRFWGQLLRWAIARELAGGSRTVRLATDKTNYQKGQQAQVTLRLNGLDGKPVSGADCTVVARQDEQMVARVALAEDDQEPGVYRALLPELPTGSVTIRAVGGQIQSLLAEEQVTEPVETRIMVDPDLSKELRHTRCNLPLLKQIADVTGGLVLPPTALAASLLQLDLAPEVSENVTQQPLWIRWAYLWVFVGCLAAEWLIRKLAGLA